MSFVTLDLRSSSNLQTQIQNQSVKQIPAPLVKIDLTPEKLNELKSEQIMSNCVSNNNSSASTQGNNSCYMNYQSPIQSIVSLPTTNQITMGSFTSINPRFSLIQQNSVSNFVNSPNSNGSSPLQSKNNTPLLISQNYNSASPNCSQNKLNYESNHLLIQKVMNVNENNILKQERKNSQNSTEFSHDETNNYQELQRKLEQQVQENQQLKEHLNKEKQRSKMFISENLTMQDELKKVQQKLKEYEQLYQLRQPIHQRTSGMRSSSSKKAVATVHSFNPRGVYGVSPKLSKNEISDDLSYDKLPFPQLGQQICLPTHLNELSQHSILDILNNLNCDDDSLVTDRQSKDVGSFTKQLKQVKANQQFLNSKSTNINNQIRRRSNVTPSYSRLETISNLPKKICI